LDDSFEGSGSTTSDRMRTTRSGQQKLQPQKEKEEKGTNHEELGHQQILETYWSRTPRKGQTEVRMAVQVAYGRGKT